MTSTLLYMLWRDFTGHRAAGNLEIPEFNRLFNAMQVDHARSLIPELAYLDRISDCNFLHVYAQVPLVDGVGSYAAMLPGANGQLVPTVFDNAGNPHELLVGCLPFHRTMVNTPCGDEPGEPILLPIPLKTDSEFGTATASNLFKPTHRYPIARLLPDRRINVAPRSINRVEALCWRVPRPIAVGTDPSILTDLRPLEAILGGVGQVDPEWDSATCLKILQRLLRAGGISINDSELAGAAAVVGGEL